MIQKINRSIAKYGIWLFLAVATYKLVFLIMNIVSSFKWNGAGGVRTLFEGCLNYAFDLAVLAILLDVSRKIAESEGVVIPTFTIQPQAPVNNYAPQAPVQPVQPVAPTPVQPAPVQQAPVQPTPVQQAPTPEMAPQGTAASVWFCSSCGTQNEGASNFCYKCGKPK